MQHARRRGARAACRCGACLLPLTGCEEWWRVAQVSATSHESQCEPSFVDDIGTRLSEMKFAPPPKRSAAVATSEIQPASDDE